MKLTVDLSIGKHIKFLAYVVIVGVCLGLFVDAYTMDNCNGVLLHAFNGVIYTSLLIALWFEIENEDDKESNEPTLWQRIHDWIGIGA